MEELKDWCQEQLDRMLGRVNDVENQNLQMKSDIRNLKRSMTERVAVPTAPASNNANENRSLDDRNGTENAIKNLQLEVSKVQIEFQTLRAKIEETDKVVKEIQMRMSRKESENEAKQISILEELKAVQESTQNVSNKIKTNINALVERISKTEINQMAETNSDADNHGNGTKVGASYLSDSSSNTSTVSSLRRPESSVTQELCPSNSTSSTMAPSKRCGRRGRKRILGQRTGTYPCSSCGKNFFTYVDCYNHKKICDSKNRLKCPSPGCTVDFTAEKYLTRHLNKFPSHRNERTKSNKSDVSRRMEEMLVGMDCETSQSSESFPIIDESNQNTTSEFSEEVSSEIQNEPDIHITQVTTLTNTSTQQFDNDDNLDCIIVLDTRVKMESCNNEKDVKS